MTCCHQTVASTDAYHTGYSFVTCTAKTLHLQFTAHDQCLVTSPNGNSRSRSGRQLCQPYTVSPPPPSHTDIESSERGGRSAAMRRGPLRHDSFLLMDMPRWAARMARCLAFLSAFWEMQVCTARRLRWMLICCTPIWAGIWWQSRGRPPCLTAPH